MRFFKSQKSNPSASLKSIHRVSDKTPELTSTPKKLNGEKKLKSKMSLKSGFTMSNSISSSSRIASQNCKRISKINSDSATKVAVAEKKPSFVTSTPLPVRSVSSKSGNFEQTFSWGETTGNFFDDTLTVRVVSKEEDSVKPSNEGTPSNQPPLSIEELKAKSLQALQNIKKINDQNQKLMSDLKSQGFSDQDLGLEEPNSDVTPCSSSSISDVSQLSLTIEESDDQDKEHVILIRELFEYEGVNLSVQI